MRKRNPLRCRCGGLKRFSQRMCDDCSRPSFGQAPVGPSAEYLALLRGEINSKEYVQSLKRQVDERLGR